MEWNFQKVRSIFLSDFHFGLPFGRSEELLELLDSTEAENIYLLGDIIDGVSIAHVAMWTERQREILDLLFCKIRHGARVYYTPGNHDDNMRSLVGRSLLGVHIANQFTYTTVHGKKLLATHGDQFDIALTHKKTQYICSTWAYALADSIDRASGAVARSIKGTANSNCRRVKNSLPGLAKRYASFESRAKGYCQKHGFDGIICGHTHSPKIETHEDGFVYMNTGDWLDHCTAIVEHLDGRIKLCSSDRTFTCFKGTELTKALA